LFRKINPFVLWLTLPRNSK